MSRMTGAQAIVKSLRRHGIDTVFGLPGIQLDHLYSAFHEAKNAIRVIHSRHEQGAAYMAFGYAQSTGRVGTYAVVPGPGVLNTTAALSTAYACNAPVLCLTGQIPSALIGRDLGILHEIPDQLGMLRGLTKWAARIDHPTQAVELVDEALHQLQSGRRRPVGLEMAMDVMGQPADVTLRKPQPANPAKPDPSLVGEAAALLAEAKRPLIFVGGGAMDAGGELLRVAKALQAPVVSVRSGRGVISDKHYLSHTQPAGHRLWAEADVVLAVGTRLLQRMQWGVDSQLRIIRVDIDPTEMGRLMRPGVGVVGDAKLAMAALAKELAKLKVRRRSRKTAMLRLKAEMAKSFAQLDPQIAYLDAIRGALPEDGFFVEELTQVGYVARFAFPVYRPRTYVTTGYQGTLGFGFATALGVKVAHPEKAVVAVCGDGGFMFNVQELATAVQHGIGVVAVVFNDNAYGNVRRIQATHYGGRVIASDLRNPDFVALARAFGATGLQATTPRDLGAAIAQALEAGGPTVIEVPVGEMPDPWHLIQLPRVRPAA